MESNQMHGKLGYFFKENGLSIKKEALWRATQLNIRGIQYALKNKISPEASLEWIQGGLSIYEAVEYHMASVPSTFSSIIKALGMQAEVLSEFFDLFQIGKVAMEWAKCRITPKIEKWSNVGFSPRKRDLGSKLRSPTKKRK
ncbi:hypothetical protein DSO57_1037189 [Entomophthora muscae]|uniref:Uncharacterized protein n=1 Tax=Entomophthora muscae TaxID=34485 RepID=A0ACC2T9W2_9FUNG|nr:hypothetical protein DSO57_1037189 [Entomophthora muscae]